MEDVVAGCSSTGRRPLFVEQEGDHSLFCPKGSFWPCFPWYGDGEQMEESSVMIITSWFFFLECASLIPGSTFTERINLSVFCAALGLT